MRSRIKIVSLPRHLTAVALIIIVNISSASAQGTSGPQQQVDELKQQYERLTAELQRRIAALEAARTAEVSDGGGNRRLRHRSAPVASFSADRFFADS